MIIFNFPQLIPSVEVLDRLFVVEWRLNVYYQHSSCAGVYLGVMH